MTTSKNLRNLFEVDSLDAMRQFAKGSPVVSLTAATVTLNARDHAGKTLVLNRAAGVVATLPAPTGTGNIYRLVVGTKVTSNLYSINAAAATQLFKGAAIVAQDGGNTLVMFEAGASDDSFDMNGTTKGGLIGDVVEFQDISATHWQVNATLKATGTEASPFASSD